MKDVKKKEWEWHGEFERKFKDFADIVKPIDKALAGWKIPVDLIDLIVMKSKLKGYDYVYFTLMNDHNPKNCGGSHLAIRGFMPGGGEICWAEDFPPIEDWPPEGP